MTDELPQIRFRVIETCLIYPPGSCPNPRVKGTDLCEEHAGWKGFGIPHVRPDDSKPPTYKGEHRVSMAPTPQSSGPSTIVMVRIPGTDRPAYITSEDFRKALVELARLLDTTTIDDMTEYGIQVLAEALDNAAFVVQQLEEYT